MPALTQNLATAQPREGFQVNSHSSEMTCPRSQSQSMANHKNKGDGNNGGSTSHGAKRLTCLRS